MPEAWMKFALVSAVGWAIFHALVKKYSLDMSPLAINAIVSISSLIFSLSCLSVMSATATPSMMSVGLLLLSGVLLGIAYWSIATAYAKGGGLWQVSAVSTCAFLSITAFIGVAIMGEVVTVQKMIGFAFAVAAIIMMA